METKRLSQKTSKRIREVAILDTKKKGHSEDRSKGWQEGEKRKPQNNYGGEET